MEPLLIVLIILLSAVGAAAGTFTGLVPGIHVNTLASIMLIAYPAIASAISGFADPAWVPVLVSACIMSASVVHSFVDFVPSVFTGAPDPDEVLSMLPGHRLLMVGHGMAAVRAAAIGSAIGAGCALLLAIPVQFIMINGLADKLDLLTLSVILFVLSVMIINEQKHRIWAVSLILVSGAMGYICMHGGLPCSGILGEGTLLFPLLSGLFGMPAMIMSTRNARIPPQKDTVKDPVGPAPGIKGVLMGCVAGWYPGITATAGASLAAAITPENEPARFISMTASIGTVTTVFSLITLSISGSGRSGTVLVIRDIVGDSVSGFCSETFMLLLVSVAVAIVLGYWITIGAGKVMSRVANSFDMNNLNKFIIVFVAALVLLLTGPCGLLILFVSTLIGFIPVMTDMSRIPLTGCLMVPVVLNELGLNDALMGILTSI